MLNWKLFEGLRRCWRIPIDVQKDTAIVVDGQYITVQELIDELTSLRKEVELLKEKVR